MKYTILAILLLFTVTATAQFYGGEPPGQIAPCACDQSLLQPLNQSGRDALRETIGGQGYNEAVLWDSASSAWQNVAFYRGPAGEVHDITRLPGSGIYDIGCFISMMCNSGDIPYGTGIVE